MRWASSRTCAIRSPALPSQSAADGLRSRRLDAVERGENRSAVSPDDLIRAFGDRDRPFCVLAQRDARNAQHGGFLLDAARVGEHHGGLGHQPEEVEIAERFAEDDAARWVDQVAEGLSSSGMHREQQGGALGDLAQGGDQPAEDLGIVDIRRAVQGDQAVLAWSQVEALPRGPSLCSLAVREQRVDHDVADEMDLVCPVALPLEVLHGIGRRSEEEVAHPVGDDPVDLLGHAPVSAAEARFDVSNEQAALGADQRAGERGVDIAHDDDGVALDLAEQVLESDEHLGGLFGV